MYDTISDFFILTIYIIYNIYMSVMANPTSDSDKDGFRKRLRTWIEDHHIPQRDLSEQLRVSYGTLRNWLSGNMPISQAKRKAILALMEHPEVFDSPNKPIGQLEYLSLYVIAPCLGMWRAASLAYKMEFSVAVPVSQEELVKFAKWSTVIIEEATKKALAGRSMKELTTIAKRITGPHDPLSDAEECSEEHCSEDVRHALAALDTFGVHIQVPVLYNRINRVFLDLAAQVQGKRTDDFVADALNEASKGDFEDELAKFLRADEDQEAENADLRADDDIPF